MSGGDVYLVNANSEDSAGFYPADIADVLLRTAEDEGWRKADPATGQPLTGDEVATPAPPTLREQLGAISIPELHEYATAHHIDSAHLKKAAEIVDLILGSLEPPAPSADVPPPADGNNPDGAAAGNPEE